MQHNKHKLENKKTTLEKPRISWHNEQPHSDSFNDIYFSSEDGLEESRYVFLKNNQLEERWRNLKSGVHYFTIIETGFGTGLNFFAAWQLWNNVAPRQCELHFISVEKSPLSIDELSRAMKNWPELDELREELLSTYPLPVPGFHRLQLVNGRIRLTLLWGDACQALEQLHAQADAWFLDGFAPTKNPGMWSPKLFQQLARLSTTDTTFSTFTAASAVRRGLQSAGFEIRRVKGFKRKREMLTGNFTGNHDDENLNAYDKPWFIQKHPVKKFGNTVTVIGGGLAGTTTAYALANRGYTVELIERSASLASGASGNPAGALFTKLNPEPSPQNSFYQQSYLFAIRYLTKLQQGNKQGENTLRWQQCGMIQLAFSEREQQLQKKIIASAQWPEELVRAIDAEQASLISGIPQQTGGLFLPQSAWIDPASLCNSLANSSTNIKVKLHHQAMTLEHSERGNWKIYGEHRQVISSSDLVVIANSADATEFTQSHHLPVKTVRGQITQVLASEESRELKTLLNYDGYTTPCIANYHCLGATFHPNDKNIELRQTDHQNNLQQLNQANPALYNMLDNMINKSKLSGRTSFRCHSPDYLPLVGPLPIKEAFINSYAGLRSGKLKEIYPLGSFYPGLFVNLAYGSRGLSSSPLCAEILASHITGEAQAIERNIVQSLHPARFLIKDLKRMKI